MTGLAKIESAWEGLSLHLLSLLRIMSALLLLQHATQKFLAFPSPSPWGPVPLGSLNGAAGALELVGGILLLVGLFTRLAAFVLSGTMAAAYFIAHSSHGFFPIDNGGELAVLYCFAFLYLSSAGPGKWALDWHVRNAERP